GLFSFKSPEGKKESVPVVTQYYPKQIVYPFGRVDRHIDTRLMQAASIAEERAHAHSRSRCWHYVKEALLASGAIDSRPKTELARDAASELVSNYGFKKLPVTDPFSAPVGSVLVYGTSRSVGHVEFRTKNGFVSDFRSPTPSRRPLLGVYAKLYFLSPRREHSSASRLRLTQTRSGNLEVGLCPNLFKLRLRFGGFICVFALPAQSFCQSKKRPAIVGQTRQVLAIDLLGFGKTLLLH